MGDRLFSVDYANGTLFVVNGPENRPAVIPVRGYTLDLQSSALKSQFGDFKDPHDIAVSVDATEVGLPYSPVKACFNLTPVVDLRRGLVGNSRSSAAQIRSEGRQNSFVDIRYAEAQMEVCCILLSIEHFRVPRRPSNESQFCG